MATNEVLNQSNYIPDQTLPLTKLAVGTAQSVLIRSGTGLAQDLQLSANRFVARDSSGGVSTHTVTDFAFTLLDDTNSSGARATLGLGNSATRNVGTTSGTVCAGDDSRLSDSRTPLSHTHPWSDITGVPSLPPRERLTADRTYYVATTGSDSNNGLTAGTPFLTIQKAIDVALTLDFNGYTVTIQLADGTYTAGAHLNRPVLGGSLIIKGNTSSPGSVIVSTTSANAIRVSNNAILTVQDMRLQTTTSGSCIRADYGGTVFFSNIDFHGCALAHIYMVDQAFVWAIGNYSITGGAAYHIYGDKSAVVDIQSRTITLTGTPNFSQYFVLVQWLACARLPSNTFSGSATGARYRADLNAVISVSGASTTYLPGDSAGVTNFGGQYV